MIDPVRLFKKIRRLHMCTMTRLGYMISIRFSDFCGVVIALT